MTEKELRKLKRSDFLQLLLAQGKDMADMQARLDKATEEIKQLQATNEHLNAKIDEKDELVDNLMGRLDDRDAAIKALQQEIEDIKASRRIELEEAGSIAVASLKLNKVFETAQKAADQYLYNIRVMHDELEARYIEKKAEQKKSEKATQPAKPVTQPEKTTQPAKAAAQDGTKPSQSTKPKSQQQTAPKAPKSDPKKQSAAAAKPKTGGNEHPPKRNGFFEKLRRLGK